MLVIYKCRFLDESSQQDETEAGIIGCATLEDALKKVLGYYGKDNILSVTLSLADNPIIQDDIKYMFE